MKTYKHNKKVNLRYLPVSLSAKDNKKQTQQLLKSKRLYKKGKYYTRKRVKSFQSKPSKFVTQAKSMYDVTKIGATKELAKKSGCSVSSLAKVINKGEGAYYSSGSRPNQTAQSWGIARLASALTSGKAGAIDYNILASGCKKGSKGYKAVLKSRRKYGFGTKRVPKVSI